jgi:isoleucyl-tRNA synthetase
MEPLDQYILARTAELDAKIRRAYDEFEFHRAYHALNEFTNTDLSALYLDVLKDRLYTFAPNHPARRSAQTALWRIAEALTRLIAPILSFTADEVWQLLPKVEGREPSVHLALFPNMLDIIPGSVRKIEEDWEQLLTVRDAVLTSLEAARQSKQIGKGLDAKVSIEASDLLYALLQTYEPSLKELFNVSQVELVRAEKPSDQVNVTTLPADGLKCERCWNYTTDVGQDSRYPTVCLRCADALQAIGYPPYAASSSEPNA